MGSIRSDIAVSSCVNIGAVWSGYIAAVGADTTAIFSSYIGGIAGAYIASITGVRIGPIFVQCIDEIMGAHGGEISVEWVVE